MKFVAAAATAFWLSLTVSTAPDDGIWILHYPPSHAVRFQYVSAQVTSAAGNFNVTNPVENQTYVTGQQLPITWRLLANTNFSSKLKLH